MGGIEEGAEHEDEGDELDAVIAWPPECKHSDSGRSKTPDPPECRHSDGGPAPPECRHSDGGSSFLVSFCIDPPSVGTSVSVQWSKIARAKASHIWSGQAAAAAVRNLPFTFPANVFLALLGPSGPT